jgi:hypothetical protein
MNEELISGGPLRDETNLNVDYGRKEEYKPNKQQILREYEISLRFLSVGCVIRVGCKEIPFINVSDAMEELNKYISNPYEEGKRWNNIFDSAQ